MDRVINKESLLELANGIIDRDDQVKIATLSDELTISQVVKFFEKQGRSFTKTMIQNYVRVGVLPPPIEKRYYTKDHLVMLTLIDNLKAIYSLDQIRSILSPIRNNPDVFDDDIIKATDVYKNYLAIRKERLNEWKDSLPKLFDRINVIEKEGRIGEGEKDGVTAFMIALSIMTETIAMKDLINGIIEGFINTEEPSRR